MPGICRVNIDTVYGGLIISSPVNGVRVRGAKIVVIGSIVADHDRDPVHRNVRMITGSRKVRARGIAICRKGDQASCGHTADTGSPNVIGG